MKQDIRSYRGYLFHVPRTRTDEDVDSSTSARFVFKSLNYHLPRSFKWLNRGGEADLRRYIDALVDRRVLIAEQYEKAGLAHSHKFIEQPPKAQQVMIDPSMLVAVMLGELPIECPINTQFVLRPSKGGRYSPSRLLAEMADVGIIDAYHAAVEEFVTTGKPVNVGYMERIHDLQSEEQVHGPDDMDPSINLREAARLGKGRVLQPPEPPQAQEYPHSTEHGEHWDDYITRIVQGHHEYYALRRVSKKGELLLIANTNNEGKWQITYKNEVALQHLTAAGEVNRERA